MWKIWKWTIGAQQLLSPVCNADVKKNAPAVISYHYFLLDCDINGDNSSNDASGGRRLIAVSLSLSIYLTLHCLLF